MDTQILEKFMNNETVELLETALKVNLGTLGANRLLLVFKKVVTNGPLPMEFDITKPTTFYNVVVTLLLSAVLIYTKMRDQFIWQSFTAGTLLLFLTAFVTWSVGLKELVALIPDAIKALRLKITGKSE